MNIHQMEMENHISYLIGNLADSGINGLASVIPDIITPRENPRRRSVGLQNEAKFNQLCWLNLAEPAPQAGASDFRVGV